MDELEIGEANLQIAGGNGKANVNCKAIALAIPLKNE
jgi:hypothetical protein